MFRLKSRLRGQPAAVPSTLFSFRSVRRPRSGAGRLPAPPAARGAGLRRALMLALAAAGIGLAGAAHALDANRASAQELERIRGIGPRTAEIIVQERERGGPFESMDDLAERVRGMGEKRIQALRAAGLEVGGDASGAARPAGQRDAASGKPSRAGPASGSAPGSVSGPAAGKTPARGAPAPAARP